MTVRERILAIKLLEKQEKNSDYIRDMGVQVNMVSNSNNTAALQHKRSIKHETHIVQR